MEELKRQQLKRNRTIAIVLALILFIGSAVSSNLFNKIGTKVEKSDNVNKFLRTVGMEGRSKNIISPGDSKEKILVVNVDGTITSGGGVYSTYNHKSTLNILDSVGSDPSIKGIVLRVNSPGGGVYESAELRHKILDLKEKTEIPIWTSMGSMAASGGYYIAAPTDKIYAAEETMTGSIGVIMTSLNMSELFEKIGIQDNTIKSDKFKDIGSASREMTEEDREILQSMIDSSYNRFIDVIVQGRGMSEEEARRVSDGRIFDGAQALENNLIDEIGYFEDTLSDMSEELGLKNPEVFEIVENEMDYLRSLIGMNAKNNKSSELDLLEDIVNKSNMERTPELMYIYGGH